MRFKLVSKGSPAYNSGALSANPLDSKGKDTARGCARYIVRGASTAGALIE